MVMFQFTLFLLVGSAIWAAGLAPAETPSDQLFPAFVVQHLPTGLAGLVIAGILAAAMGTHSSAINSLASSATHDLYASWTGRRDPAHLLRVGRVISAAWALGLVAGALFFAATSGTGQTPVVAGPVHRLGDLRPLLGTYVRGPWPRARGRDVVGAVAITVALMLVVVFAKRLADTPGSSGSGRSVGWPALVRAAQHPAGVGSGVARAMFRAFLLPVPHERHVTHSHGADVAWQQDGGQRVRRTDDLARAEAGRRSDRARDGIGLGDRRESSEALAGAGGSRRRLYVGRRAPVANRARGAAQRRSAARTSPPWWCPPTSRSRWPRCSTMARASW
jgi:hypothetical protein